VSVKLAIAKKKTHLCQIEKIRKKKVNGSHHARHGNKARRERLRFNVIAMLMSFA